MKKIVFTIFALALPMMAFAADPYKLACADKSENELLKQAPHGAKRVGKHVLEVKYSAGIRKFTDKPPHDFGEGLHWQYCGYNENVKAHLIVSQADEMHSGSLLFDVSGKVIKAGSSVVLSPNQRNFLAIEQEAGSDGQNWTLYETSGKILWEGFSTIEVPRKPNAAHTWEAVTIDNPSLSDDLQISVHMSCWQSKKEGNITLKKVGGKWEWLPKIEC